MFGQISQLYFNIQSVSSLMLTIDHQLEFPQIVHHKSFIHLNVHLLPQIEISSGPSQSALLERLPQASRVFSRVMIRMGSPAGDRPLEKLLLKPLLLLSTPTKWCMHIEHTPCYPTESCQRGQCGFGNAAMRFLTRWELTNPTSLLPRRTGDGLQILVFKTFLI